jgi:hypothetical protein
MQVVDDGTPAQIEEILAHAAITRPSSLPPAHTSQSMLYSSPFAQFGPSLWGLLPLLSFDKQCLIGMDADASPSGTGRTLRSQGTLRADLFGKMDDATGHKRHFLRSWTANDLSFPVQGERVLVKVFSLANRPSFAIDFQLVAAPTRPVGCSDTPGRYAAPSNALLAAPGPR